MIGRKLSLLVIFISIFLGAHASGEYSRITMSDGLPGNCVTTVHRDNYGFVWVGTLEGISRFDGVNIKRYELLNADGDPVLPKVYRVMDNKHAGLMLCTSEGLYIYDHRRDRFLLDDVLAEDISCAVRYGDFVVAGGSEGLLVKNLKSGEVSRFLENEKINAISEGDQCIYVLSEFYLYTIKIPNSSLAQGAFEFRQLVSHKHGVFSDLIVDGNTIYIGNDRQGAFEYNIKDNIFAPVENLGAKIVRSFSLRGDMLYVATDGMGVFVYDTRRKEVVSRINKDSAALGSNAILGIDVDNRGVVWLGSFSSGLYYSQPEENFISPMQSTLDLSARCIYRVASNRYIIGTRDGLVLWRNGEIYRRFHSEEHETISSNIILSIYPYRDYLYIIGTFCGGVFLLDEQSGEIFPFDASSELNDLLSDKSVYGINVIDGEFYFFTLNGLVRYSTERGGEVWDENNSLMPSALIYSNSYDAKRNIFWLGTSKGLCRFDIARSRIESVELEGVQNDFRTNVMHLDKDGNLLLDRNYNELLRIDSENFEVDRIDYAPRSIDHISGIIEDNNGRDLWVATTNGLYCYNQNDSQSIKFIEASGLENTNICPNSVMKLSDNRLIFGTEGGVYSLLPKSRIARGKMNPIYLSSVKINGNEALEEILLRSFKSMVGQSEYHIKVDVRDMIEIEVIDPAFLRARENRYAFSIDGEEWIYSESNKFVVGNSLDIGRHPIYVKVVGESDTSWSRPILIGRISVGLSTATIVWMVVLLLLVVSYFIFWREIRKLILLNKRKNSVATKATLDNKRFVEMLARIRESLERDKGYRNPTFRLKDLADCAGLSAADVSQVLNNHLHLSFSDFINDYRIEEIKQLLLEEDANYYMLHVLAERCGFNSKTSFYRIFKNKTGLTPLQYRKEAVGENQTQNQTQNQTETNN